MIVKVLNEGSEELPEYKTEMSAGCDLRASLEEDVELYPMERKLIPTGLNIQLPIGYEAQIRPRSGLALRYGITVLNSPGTIDADYRGELMVLLINLSDSKFVVHPHDRIAQMVIARHERAEFELTDFLSPTTRGDGGYGHTGVK